MSLDLYQHLYQPATAPDLPTILALHGTGGNERDLLGLVQAIAPGCGVLSLRGNVSERGMPRFFRRFAEGVFDLEDVQVRAGQIATFLKIQCTLQTEHNAACARNAFGFVSDSAALNVTACG
jgi:predicted esterase